MIKRPRWRKVVSDLTGSKVRSILVVASIGIGLFAVGLIVNAYLIITQDMRAGYSAVNPANVIISTTFYDPSELYPIRNIAGVRQAEGVFAFTLRFHAADGSWKPISIQAIPKIENKQIDTLKLLKGSWPPADKELVVDGYNLAKLPVGVGGMVEIELPSGAIRKVKLVGVVNDQTVGATDPGGFFLAPVQGYMTYATLPWLEMPATLNTLRITVSGDANDLEHLRAVSNQVSQFLKNAGQTVSSAAIRAMDDHPNRVYVDAIAAVLIVLGFLVMFLSAFLITNTLSALLNQQMHQIGVMKTIGASRQQVASIYMLQIFFFGLIAFVIAQPLSSYAAYALLGIVANQINILLQGFRVIPLVVLLQLAIALVVPQAAGFIPILQGTRITTVEALSGYNQSKPPSGRAWNPTNRIVKRIPRPVLLSLRNTFRRRGRLALTLTTLTLGGAVFIATFNTSAALTNYIAQIGRYFLADVNLTFKQYYRLDQITQSVMKVPGVAAVEAWSSAEAELVLPNGSVGESISLLAPPAGSQLVNPVLLEGRWIETGDTQAITVNEPFRMLIPNLKVGDTLQLKIAGKVYDMKVVGFFQLAGESGGSIGYTTYSFLSDAIHEPNRAQLFRVTASQSKLNLSDQDALGRALEKQLVAENFDVQQVESGHSLTATTANGLSILTDFLLIMALLTAIVGSIGLAGTMSMNVLERTREIGIVRAIGASDRAVINLVMAEGVLIGLMSWALGTALSFPITSLMSNAIIESLFGATAKFTFSPEGVILWLVIVLVLSALASVLPARNAASLTIREVLAYE